MPFEVLYALAMVNIACRRTFKIYHSMLLRPGYIRKRPDEISPYKLHTTVVTRRVHNTAWLEVSF